MPYCFYIIVSSSGRIGFGIAQNIYERNKQYCSHSGDIVNMTVYSGQRTHAKALERTIKTQYSENLWVIDDWITEWLNDTVNLEDFKNYVDSLISERHLKLSLYKENYNFTEGILT